MFVCYCFSIGKVDVYFLYDVLYFFMDLNVFYWKSLCVFLYDYFIDSTIPKIMKVNLFKKIEKKNCQNEKTKNKCMKEKSEEMEENHQNRKIIKTKTIFRTKQHTYREYGHPVELPDTRTCKERRTLVYFAAVPTTLVIPQRYRHDPLAFYCHAFQFMNDLTLS